MSRPIFSRPRTRVYGCNYDKGESYYKPMVDHLDRKYSGRPLFSEPRNSFADEIAARRSDIGNKELTRSEFSNSHNNDLDLELFPRSKARLSFQLGDKDGGGSSGFDDDDEMVYDIRGQKTKRRNLADDFANDVAASTSRFKNRIANINFTTEPYGDLKSELISQKKQNKTSIISDVIQTKSNIKQSTATVVEKYNKEKENITSGFNRHHSTIVKDNDDDDLDINAAIRARRTKNRLLDLENEMEELVKKQDKRERRAAALHAFMNENIDDINIQKKF